MRKGYFFVMFTLILASAFAQNMQVGNLAFELPAGLKAEKSNKRLYVYDGEGTLSLVVYSPYDFNGNLEEALYTLWKQEEKFPWYTEGDMMKRYEIEIANAKGLRADFEGESEKGRAFKSVLTFQHDNTIDGMISYTTNPETQYLLESLVKSLSYVPSQAAPSLSPLQRSFRWYSALRGPHDSNSSLQVYQAQTSLNFTGFMTPSQQHLQNLGDSLFYLRELPNLHTILIGQTRMDDAAAANIGSLPSIKKLATVSQGLYVPLTNAGLQALSKASTLEELDLQGIDISGVTDDGMVHVAKLTQLRKLVISRATRISITGIEKLVTLKQLRELNLSYCILSDADIPRLITVIQQLPALQTLYIQTTNMSVNGTLSLRQTFPNITIYR